MYTPPPRTNARQVCLLANHFLESRSIRTNPQPHGARVHTFSLRHARVCKGPTIFLYLLAYARALLQIKQNIILPPTHWVDIVVIGLPSPRPRICLHARPSSDKGMVPPCPQLNCERVSFAFSLSIFFLVREFLRRYNLFDEILFFCVLLEIF